MHALPPFRVASPARVAMPDLLPDFDSEDAYIARNKVKYAAYQEMQASMPNIVLGRIIGGQVDVPQLIGAIELARAAGVSEGELSEAENKLRLVATKAGMPESEIISKASLYATEAATSIKMKTVEAASKVAAERKAKEAEAAEKEAIEAAARAKEEAAAAGAQEARAAAEAKAILDAANEAAKNAEAKAAAKAAAEKEAAEKRAMAAGTAQSGSKGMPAGGVVSWYDAKVAAEEFAKLDPNSFEAIQMKALRGRADEEAAKRAAAEQAKMPKWQPEPPPPPAPPSPPPASFSLFGKADVVVPAALGPGTGKSLIDALLLKINKTPRGWKGVVDSAVRPLMPELRDAFDKADTDGDGRIDASAVSELLKVNGDEVPLSKVLDSYRSEKIPEGEGIDFTMFCQVVLDQAFAKRDPPQPPPPPPPPSWARPKSAPPPPKQQPLAAPEVYDGGPVELPKLADDEYTWEERKNVLYGTAAFLAVAAAIEITGVQLPSFDLDMTPPAERPAATKREPGSLSVDLGKVASGLLPDVDKLFPDAAQKTKEQPNFLDKLLQKQNEDKEAAEKAVLREEAIETLESMRSDAAAGAAAAVAGAGAF